jgi:hypothetical protein
MTKLLEAYREPKGVQDKPAKLHPAKAEPPEFLSADVTIAEPAVTPPAVTPRHDEPVTHTGGPVASALSAGSVIPAAMGATSAGGPNGSVPLTYSDQHLKENIVQAGALFEVSADQPLVVTDVGGGFTHGHHEPVMPHEQLETDFHVERRHQMGPSSNRRVVTALSHPGSPDDRGHRPQCPRNRDQRFVCSIVGVD